MRQRVRGAVPLPCQPRRLAGPLSSRPGPRQAGRLQTDSDEGLKALAARGGAGRTSRGGGRLGRAMSEQNGSRPGNSERLGARISAGSTRCKHGDSEAGGRGPRRRSGYRTVTAADGPPALAGPHCGINMGSESMAWHQGASGA